MEVDVMLGKTECRKVEVIVFFVIEWLNSALENAPKFPDGPIDPCFLHPLPVLHFICVSTRLLIHV